MNKLKDGLEITIEKLEKLGYKKLMSFNSKQSYLFGKGKRRIFYDNEDEKIFMVYQESKGLYAQRADPCSIAGFLRRVKEER